MPHGERAFYAVEQSRQETNTPWHSEVWHICFGSRCSRIRDPAKVIDMATLNSDQEDFILTHQRPGPFTDSDLHEVLQARGIQNVIVCGVATNASVEAAVRQTADLGYHTVVLTDACSAADEAAHEASLASLSLFAQHTTLAELTV